MCFGLHGIQDEVDVDAFQKDPQRHSIRTGKTRKSKFDFERTAVSNFKSEKHEDSGNEIVIIPELRLLVLTKRLWVRDWSISCTLRSSLRFYCASLTKLAALENSDTGMILISNGNERICQISTRSLTGNPTFWGLKQGQNSPSSLVYQPLVKGNVDSRLVG